MKRRTIRKIVVMIVVLVVGYPLYQYWQAEKEYENIKYFFYNLSQTIEVSGGENTIENARNYREELAEWNLKTGKALDTVFSGYRRPEDSNINKSIGVVQTLIDNVYELRNETVPLVEPLFSQRMQDPRTVKDDTEYEWRMQTLDAITTYNLKYKKRLLEVCETFRTTLVGSDLPEKYRTYIWNDWSNHLHHYITAMGPQVEMFDGMADNYKKLFHYLYVHKNDYYIDAKGNILFDDKRRSGEYQRLFSGSGIAWRPS